MAETLIPEARGKAAAFDRWLAQGGKPFRVSGRFKEGPMKGMTYDQAKQKFEDMWASSPDELKDRYAARSKTDLSPSERMVSGLTPAPPKDMSPAAVQKRRMAGYGFELDQNGNAVPLKKPAVTPAATSPASTAKPTTAPLIPGVKPSPAVTPAPERPKFARRGGTSPTAIAGRATTGASPSAATVAPTPVRIMPTTPAYTGGRSDLSPLAQRELANRKAAVDATPTGRPVVAKPTAGINRLTGLPFGYQPGDAQAPGGPAIDPKLAAQSVKRQEVATSKAAIQPPKPLIPGITPPKPQPTALEQSQINRPRTGVAPDSVEGRAVAAFQRYKEMEANPNPVNPPGLRLVGPKRPLDELVKRQKLQGIGTPARQ